MSTTSAGEISINNYSGNPVIIHSDASTNGSKLPVSVSHVYNGYMANKNIANIKPYAGKGWKLNIQQMVRPSSEYGLTGTSATNYPYVYTDEDGTEHYFKKVGTQYLDEDGLNLELKKTAEGYTITDSADTVMSFNASGLISQITDSNGNTITYTYSGNAITKVTDGNNQMITLEYNTDGYLTKITDHSGKSTTYTYTNGLLTKVTYPNSKTSTYTYDSDSALTKLTSTDGTAIQLYYTSLSSGKRVNKIVEKGSGDILGQTVKFDRTDYNITEIITSGVDYQIDTDDDVITILEFDNAGRLRSTCAYTEEKDIGAQSTQYTSSQTNASNSNIKKLNRITRLASLDRIALNKLTNHSGESTTGWSHSASVGTATFSFTSTNEEYLFGKKSFKVDVSQCSSTGRARFNQDLSSSQLTPGETYTLSAYVKTKNVVKQDVNASGGAVLIAYCNSSTASSLGISDSFSEYIVGTTDEAVHNGWRRISVTFTAPTDINYLRVNLGLKNATGVAYFDGIQLEKGDAPQAYNMIENCSFEKATSSLPNSWDLTNTTSSDTVVSGYYMDDTHSMRMTASPLTKKEVSQTIAVSGSEEDTYVVGGWAFGKGVKARNSNREFDISIQVKYSDGTSVWKTPAVFNDSVRVWKYTAVSFDLSDGTDEVKTPASIKICLRAYGQANTVYFDSIQLLKKSVTTNIYDDNGNLINADNEQYVYTDNNMTSSTDSDGNTTDYEYDDNGNLTSATTESGIKDDIVYDEYGNIIEESVTGSDNSLKVKSESVYDPTKSYKIKDIDEDGKETLYNYDISKGLLNSITDARGNTVSYAYDNQNQLTSVTSSGITNTFTYDDKGRTTGITHAGASYGMTYDGFNNKMKTLIGSATIVTDTYANGNGDLIKRTLSNGHYLEYQYDERGNLVCLKENGNIIEKDIYDSLGNMIYSYDYKTNVKLQFDYDLNGRIIRIDAFNMNASRTSDARLYGSEYGYDSSGKLIKQIDYSGNQKNITEYTYGSESHISEYKVDTSKKINYTYDSLDRTTSKSLNTSRAVTTSYSYADSLRGSEYTTTKISKEIIDGIEYAYAYDEIGNITSITAKKGNTTQKTDYIYDANSQLIRENNQQLNKTIAYEYDNGGNIVSKKEYAYTTGTLQTPTKTVNYGYTNTNWKDQLTSYDGQSMTYDSSGNPLSYKGYTMTWNGRELMSMTNGSDTISYSYGSDGMRRTKTVNNTATTYDYVGDVLTHEKRSDSDLYYTYDDKGNLTKITLVKNNTSTDYYVTTNMRGDVEAIYNASGTLQARYIYDSWGKTVSIIDANDNIITDTNNIGHINPIRYRGYYLDSETGLYYLQSRYYDAEVTRFINADDIESIYANDGIMSFNAYLYSSNTPENMVDSDGDAPINVICAAIGMYAGWHFGDYIAKKLGYRSGWKYSLIRAGVVIGGGVIGWFAGKLITKIVANYFKNNISLITKMATSNPKKLKIVSDFFGVNPFKTMTHYGQFVSLAQKIASTRYVSDLKWAKYFYEAAKKFGYKVALDSTHGGYTYHLHLVKMNGVRVKDLHFEITKAAYNYFFKLLKKS